MTRIGLFHCACVGLGGLTGSILRYLVQTWMVRSVAGGFPWGTLTVNVVPCVSPPEVPRLLVDKLPGELHVTWTDPLPIPDEGVLFSVHLKATMMKVSDPIIFGHVVRVFLADVFDKYSAELEEVGANPNNGLGSVLNDIQKLPADKAAAITSAIEQSIGNGPDLAMVDSDKGITNLHVPSDVIIDASMPAMIRLFA